MSYEKGIVVTDYSVSDEGHMQKHYPEGVSLRYYLLYWDKIDFPVSNLMYSSLSNDLAFLHGEGILSRTMIDIILPESAAGKLWQPSAASLIQFKTLEKKDKESPGTWSLAQKGSRLFLPEFDLIEKKNIEVELYSLLPVPIEDVPLQDILEFKVKRSDELESFRSTMSGLYMNIVNSGDIPTAQNLAVEQLKRSIEELNKVFNESWDRKLLHTIKSEINIETSFGLPAAGAALAPLFDFSPKAGAIIGAVTAALKVSWGTVKSYNSLTSSVIDYAYLHKIEKEVGKAS
ncbi:MAG: hypothetical protein JKY08_11645 [Flavobacteriaceae bacterium]|nr:hypothetical protein [Flavobacteriaceae bacterium]